MDQKNIPDYPPSYNEAMNQQQPIQSGSIYPAIPSAPLAESGPIAGSYQIQMPVTQPPQSYGTIKTEQIAVPATNIIIVGGCPVCRIGVLEDDFTCCGICCAIFFFPVGLICCLLMKEKRCKNCNTRI